MVKDVVKKNSKELSVDDTIKLIHTKLRGIARNFIEVGIQLNNIQELGLYKEKGFTSMAEFSTSSFGLSKNQTYNLINVAKSFSSNNKILDRYKEFSFSQLVEMVTLPEKSKEEITPDMTVRDIRTKKSAVKKKSVPTVGTETKDNSLDNSKIIDSIIENANLNSLKDNIIGCIGLNFSASFKTYEDNDEIVGVLSRLHKHLIEDIEGLLK